VRGSWRGSPAFDRYQFIQTDAAVEDSWAAMVRLVDEGKVRAIGVSNFDSTCSLAARRSGTWIRSAAVLADQPRRAVQELPVVRKHDTGVNRLQARMQSGLLTTALRRSHIVARRHDWRRGAPEFKQPNLRRNLELARRARSDRENGMARPCRQLHRVDTRVAGYQRRDRRCAHSKQVDGWIGAA